VAYGPVKGILRQGNICKYLLEIRKAETKQKEAVIIVRINQE
jgi:hypothetical protein